MKYSLGLLTIILLISCQEKQKVQSADFTSSEIIQMAAPKYVVDSAFFRNSAAIDFKFRYPNAIVRYTTDGTEVTSAAKAFEKPIVVNKTSAIKAKVFHPDFTESEEVIIKVTQIKNDISNATLTITPEYAKEYSGVGNKTLVDLKKGTFKTRSVDTWLGFNASEVVIKAKLQSEIVLSKIKLSTLTTQSGWIFSPHTVSVFSGTEQVGQHTNTAADKKEETAMKVIEIPVKPQKYKTLKIVVHSLEKMPNWHASKGLRPWFFIDELILE